jgi:hypothetical protein
MNEQELKAKALELAVMTLSGAPEPVKRIIWTQIIKDRNPVRCPVRCLGGLFAKPYLEYLGVQSPPPPLPR